MNNFGFHFAESYQGYWNIAQIGRKIPGTLYLEKHSIRLELFWNNVTHRDIRVIPSATGYAYTEICNNKQCYYFVLKELQLISVSWFGHHQSQYKLDVNYFCMSDKPRFSTNGIVNCCLRTQLMDKWVWEYTRNSYSDIWPFKENESLEVKYQAKPSLTLFESVLFELYLKFGYEAHTPNADGFGMSTHTFLNLRLKKKQKFYDALDLTESVIWLFSLFWNNQFIPDFIEFRTSKAKFIYKQSDRYSYKYRDVNNSSLRTDISDFNVEELSTIIEKWFRFIEREIVPIRTFFETQYDEYMTPSAVLKNYMSVIDGLSRELEVPTTGQSNNSKKYKRFEDILNKIKPQLKSKELNEIKMAIFRESPSELKPRFVQLINNLSDYTYIALPPDFCQRAVETRNLLIHTRSSGKDVFHKEQYRDVAFCLEDIIRAYILYKICVPKEIVNKILWDKISMPS